MKFTSVLPIVLCVIAVILGQSCSRQSEPPPAASEPRAAPPPAPTTGSVQGQLTGQKSGKPLPGQLIVLCQVEAEPKCNLRTALQATTDDAGAFSIKDVGPGRYTVVYTKRSDKALEKLVAGLPIDPTVGRGRVLPGTVVDIGSRGGLANIRGAVVEGTSGLTFEFRNGKLAILEVRAGETTKVEIRGWGQ